MKTIRWGIIGCGDVTEVKSGPGFQKADHSDLVAVMRRRGELARDYAERHGVPRWYDNAAALIGDSEVDAIYIATPPSSHKEYTLMSAAAGKPVYVEKPMALNFAECEEMISTCRQAGVPLFVAYYRRALPRFLKIKELVDSGGIGEVRFVHMTFYQPLAAEDQDPGTQSWRVDPAVGGGGRFCVMLTGFGLLGDKTIYQRSLGININLWWGIVLLVFWDRDVAHGEARNANNAESFGRRPGRASI